MRRQADRSRQTAISIVVAGMLAIAVGSVAAPRSAAAAPAPSPTTPPAAVPDDVAAAVASHPTDVVVSFNPAAGIARMETATRGHDDPAHRETGAAAGAAAYAQAKDAALQRAGGGAATKRDFAHLPVQVVRIDSADALQRLAQAPDVVGINLPRQLRIAAPAPSLTQIHQPEAVAAGATGAGVRVAVVDTGLNVGADPALFGNCSGGPGTGSCRVDSSTYVSGAGANDRDTIDHHGTNVAGIVATVAPGVHIDSYGVFTGAPDNLLATEPDILGALNQVAQTAVARNVRAVNLSLETPGSYETSACTSSAFSSAFQSLRGQHVVPVVAAGNEAYANPTFTNGVSYPACATGALRVGAVYSEASNIRWWGADCVDAAPQPNDVVCFSQTGPLLSVLAPGVDIAAAGETLSGTSQATPHVSGAIAAITTINPHATAEQIASAITGNGPQISDARTSPPTVKRLLDIQAAATEIADHLVVTAPANATQGSPMNVTVSARNGNGFLDPSFSGTVSFSSTDAAATLPAPAAITNGTGTYSVTMHTVGTATITATAGSPALTATSGPITVAEAPPGPPPPSPANVLRYSGPDRIATSIAASLSSYPSADSAGAAVIASAEDYPDGLSGTPLAAALHAPLLLTNKASLRSDVLNEVARVLPANGAVYVLGGPEAISDSVMTALSQAGFQPHRIAGANRFETATAIANAISSPTVVLLATGLNFPDALAAGVAAAHVGGVVLFTQGTTQAPATQAWLNAHSSLPVVIVGGTAAGTAPGATAIVGADRYATSAMVADHFFPSVAVAGLASGVAFPDALSGGAHIAALGGPMLLTPPGGLPTAVDDWFRAHAADVVTVHIYGGTAAVSAAVASGVASATS